MRKHLYLITEHDNPDLVGNVEISDKPLAMPEKNIEMPSNTRNIETGERTKRMMVGLGHHDFEDEGDYQDRVHEVVVAKLEEVDREHIDKAGIEIPEVPS